MKKNVKITLPYIILIISLLLIFCSCKPEIPRNETEPKEVIKNTFHDKRNIDVHNYLLDENLEMYSIIVDSTEYLLFKRQGYSELQLIKHKENFNYGKE